MSLKFEELVKLVEEVSTNYQKSDRIKKHATKRLSTKGKKNKDGTPYSQDPPTARAKSAPPGAGFTMEELYKLIDEALEEQPWESDEEEDIYGSLPDPDAESMVDAALDGDVLTAIKAKMLEMGEVPQGKNMERLEVVLVPPGKRKSYPERDKKVMVPEYLRSEPQMLEVLKQAMLSQFPEPEHTFSEYVSPRTGNPQGWLVSKQVGTTKGGKPKVAVVSKYYFKPSGRSSLNQGDVAEGILGAGLYAKFLNPAATINEGHIHTVLEKIKAAAPEDSGGKNTRAEITKVSKRKGGADEVTLTIALAKANFDALVDPKWHAELKGKYKSVLAYLAGEKILEGTQEEAVDKKKSKIEIISDGVGDQKGTKVDVKVIIDNQPTTLGQISLKAGSKQLGQVGSGSWDLISGGDGFFADVLTVQPAPSLEEAWRKAWEEKNGVELNKLGHTMYKQMAKEVKALRGTDDDGDTEAAFITRMVKGIRQAAAGYTVATDEKTGEKTKQPIEGVKVLDFDRGDYKILDFDLLSVVLDAADIDLVCEYTKEDRPKIIIRDKNGAGSLISIRMRFEGEVARGKEISNLRHYVEKEPLLSKLINIATPKN